MDDYNILNAKYIVNSSRLIEYWRDHTTPKPRTPLPWTSFECESLLTPSRNPLEHLCLLIKTIQLDHKILHNSLITRWCFCENLVNPHLRCARHSFQSLKSHPLSIFNTLTWNSQNPKKLCQMIRLFQDYNGNNISMDRI